MRRKVQRWSGGDLARMIHMREVEGLNWVEIDKAFGRGPGSCSSKYSMVREGASPRAYADAAMRVEIAGDRAALRDARKLAQSRLSLTGVLLGDPPPGYSALDRVKP